MDALSEYPQTEQAKLAAHSLYLVFKQLPDETQREFVNLLGTAQTGYVNEQWTDLSAPTLRAIWDSPEEDLWDKLYEKQCAGRA